ncbi:MAG: hypothetical protein ACI9JR_003160 [Gammaproteobacteria bacterium]|jgi:hypothetical protein
MFNLFVLLALGLLAYYWWHSGEFKSLALSFATKYCEQFSLQLLDQSMVINGFWVERNPQGSLAIRRSYQFEFCSTGEQRYQGSLVLMGMTLKSIDLETYKIPGQ